MAALSKLMPSPVPTVHMYHCIIMFIVSSSFAKTIQYLVLCTNARDTL